jgi:hypothetical protein
VKRVIQVLGADAGVVQRIERGVIDELALGGRQLRAEVTRVSAY